MKTPVAVLFLLLAFPSHAGTWGLGQFQNDEALDRSYDWAESGSVADIRMALENVQQLPYIEAPEAMAALVAAEVVAASMGRPSTDLPDDLKAWTERQPVQDLQDLAALARSAASRITSPDGSELYELWADQEVSAWLATVAELERRLATQEPARGP